MDTLTHIGRRRLITAAWDLNARGNGTVTYHMFRLPGSAADVWPEDLPGAVCERRERGGTYRSDERQASSEYTYDALPVGTRMIEITVEYRAGEKRGSTRETKVLLRYEPGESGKWRAVWE